MIFISARLCGDPYIHTAADLTKVCVGGNARSRSCSSIFRQRFIQADSSYGMIQRAGRKSNVRIYTYTYKHTWICIQYLHSNRFLCHHLCLISHHAHTHSQVNTHQTHVYTPTQSRAKQPACTAHLLMVQNYKP